MMKVKMLEIRDAGTFIPVLCTAMVSDNPDEDYLLGRVGYGEHRLILVTWLTCNRSEYAPLNWGGRTLPTAHKYIEDAWGDLESGDVIDVEYILGETEQPKVSERWQ